MSAGNVILKVRDLKKWFPLRRSLTEAITFKPRRYVRAVDGVSFDLHEGEIFCLVGESGCGKTTTGRMITRLIVPTAGHMYFRASDEVKSMTPERFVSEDGYIDIANPKLPKRVDKALRREIQIVFQDPFGSLNPRMKVYDILKEPLIVHGIGASEEERRELIYRALSEVKLVPPDEFIGRYPHMLSGGQRQRVAFARAMILGPKLVVADEPVSMLDVSIRAEILKLMMDLKEAKGLTYLFITHDLAVAAYLCNRIAVMYLGKIVELAPTEELINNPLHPYTKALLAAVPEPDPSNRFKIREVPIKGEVPSAANIPPGCRFHPRCLYMMDICKKEEPELFEISSGHYVACHLYKKK